tara:strand:- start:855 stop:1205 length:351 start_codon:yes stop_codon:yes gene_type:complete
MKLFCGNGTKYNTLKGQCVPDDESNENCNEYYTRKACTASDFCTWDRKQSSCAYSGLPDNHKYRDIKSLSRDSGDGTSCRLFRDLEMETNKVILSKGALCFEGTTWNEAFYQCVKE